MQGILGNDYHYHVTNVNGDAAVYEFISTQAENQLIFSRLDECQDS